MCYAHKMEQVCNSDVTGICTTQKIRKKKFIIVDENFCRNASKAILFFEVFFFHFSFPVYLFVPKKP